MGNRDDVGQEVGVRELFRALGEPIKFEIVRALGEDGKYPKQLAAEFNLSRGDVSQHLQKLRELGIVEWVQPAEADGRLRLYRLRRPLPTPAHQLIVGLALAGEKEESAEALDWSGEEREKIREQIETKKSEKFWITLRAIAAHTQLPVGMVGKAQKRLREELQELKEEIDRLSAREFELVGDE